MSDDILNQDIFTIDTGAGILKEEKIEPLPLFDENHPMLSKPIPEYKQALPNQNMNILIKRLKMTMKQFAGLGLSANQCGVFERVFVIGSEHFQFACINPKIIDQSAEMIKDNEGCLSYPALYLKIERPNSIQVEFTDENGQRQQTMLEGLSARCFLHELDHMNGVRMVDRVKPLALQMARDKQKKLIKKISRLYKR